jgi:hypothetical protein
MRSNHNVKGKQKKLTILNYKPTKIIRDKHEKINFKKKSYLKNVDLKRKRTKFDIIRRKKTKS